MRFVVLFLAITLYAQNLVDIYRYDGTKELVKQIENRLCSTDYWLNRIKDKNVTYGYFDNPKDILVCTKEKKILNVYDFDGYNLKRVDSIKVLTGLDGQKEKEGDLKTPIGVYTLVSLLNKVDQYYGPFAFETSYPNLFDRVRGKDGHGIWIHGVPLKGQRDSNNTKGCIVMQNNRLEKLKKEINYKNTYLLISEKTPLTATKKEIASLLAFIYRWRRAWENSAFDKYKTFYADDFKKGDGKNLKEFLDYKKRVFENKKGQNVEILFRDINIIPYQNIDHKKLFRIDMYEIYNSRDYHYKGPKELYVYIKNGKMKILVEK